ncbi:DUF6443 domain-containing protein [uncultured Pedobacter sp.]|uniref:DUF6443 domain-containing protein n=1 Tax=uncultured Pedobacter sp. TaxID=246139 RepID=UPI00263408EB|nr:DUF6443 domain-containing protein [uncultured Pedobacter sp.]
MKNIYLMICLLIAGTIHAQNSPGDNNPPEPTAVFDYPVDYTDPLILNFTREITALQPANSDAQLNGLRLSGARTMERTTYTDGLGRPLQVVVKKTMKEGTARDLIKHYNYDAFGRISKDLLIYTSSDRSVAAENTFNKKIFSDLQATYKTRLGYVNEDFRYQVQLFEQSPRALIEQQQAAGNSWAGREKGVAYVTRGNVTADQVKIWQIDFAQGSLPATTINSYLPSSLVVQITTDEDGKETKNYYDLESRLILTDIGGARTYYVYDVYGRLRYTIPPLAVEQIESNNWVLSQSISDNLCFVNEYDDRGQTVSVKKPGIGKTSYRYNERGQMVFSQDAIGLSKNQWVFYKYDNQGRLVQQGIYSGQMVFSTTGNGLVDYIYTDNIKAHSDYQYSFADTKFYVHYYYDNYDFFTYIKEQNSGYETALQYSPVVGDVTEGYNKTMSKQIRGMLTGVYTLTSGSDEKWLARAHYYNSNEQLIQTVQEDLYGHFSFSAMGYDFAGRMTKSINQDDKITIQKKYTYDAYGRIMYIEQKIGNASIFRRIASYTYDDIGRLKQKTLGGMNHPVVYDYNIRNWLTGINGVYCDDKSTNLFFGMQLSYEYGFRDTKNSGSISGIKWRNAGTGSDLRSYGYTYDGQVRLSHANYLQWDTDSKPNDPDWNNGAKDFTTENIAYDANGNLLSMRHQGLGAAGNKIVLDDLNYHYQTGSNTLASVDESGSSESTDPAVHDQLGDFRDVSGTDYTYDANGNLASDKNRNIETINSNWFTINKPLETTQKAGELTCRVTYIYDALGNLLQKKASWGASGTENTKVFDYYGSLVYEDLKPSLLMHEEGRVRIETDQETGARTYNYDFYLRDHINNVRSVLTESSYDLFDEAGEPGTYDPNVSAANPLNNAPVGYIATSELQNNSWETALFDRIGDTRDPRPLPTDPDDAYAALLNAAQGKVLGPGKMIKVMAGDRVQLGAESYFRSGTNPETPVPMQTLVENLIMAICNTAPVSADGNGPFSGAMFDVTNISMTLNQIQNNNQDTTRPRAFLNFLLFDQNFNVVHEASGAIQVEQSNAWEPMDVSRFDIPVSGYLYVFTSNQSNVTVHTDNLYLMHWKGSLLEEMHYYPFGLTFDVNHQSTSVAKTNNKFNSQSFEQNEFRDANDNLFGLNWYDFMARSYDPQIGRWMQPDPMMQHASPYLALRNNPTSYVDPIGLLDDWIGVDEATGKVVASGESDKDEVYWVKRTDHGTWESQGVMQGWKRDFYLTTGLKWSKASYATRSGSGEDVQTFNGYGQQEQFTSNRLRLNASKVNSANNYGATMIGALSIAGVTSASDGPLPVGETVGALVISAATLAIAQDAVYRYGPTLAAKMEMEIDRIKQKATGPQGVQYSLRATQDGFYPNVRGGAVFLQKGDVWKYGETTNPTGRYTQGSLTASRLKLFPEFYGNQVQIKVEEKIKIYGYFFQNGTLPPGNRIFR